MKILHTRTAMTAKSTTGTLSIDGKPFAVTLEDVERPAKIHGKTAIPAGKYPVVVTYSPKFKRDVVMLVGVAGFSRIYCHCGNKAEDTEGCVLIAKRKVNGDYIQGDSKKLEAELLKRVKSALAVGESVTWQVVGFVVV